MARPLAPINASVRERKWAFKAIAGFAATWAAFFVCAASAQRPHVAPALTLPSPGCVRDFEDHTGAAFDVCGYRSIAINADGSRILVISIAGQVQLFDPVGRLIAETPARTSPASSTTALFVDDTAIALVDRSLSAFDAHDGAPRFNRTLPGNYARPAIITHSTDGALFLQIQSYDGVTRQVSSAVLVIDATTGETIKERPNTGAMLYGPTRAWAAGTSADRSGDTTRFFVVLADRDLTAIEIAEYCQPFGPTPRCVSFNYATRQGVIHDLISGVATPFDLSRLVAATSLVEWHAVGQRNVAIVRTGEGAPSQFAIIDLDGPRLIRTFEANLHRVAIGVSDGAPELRLGATTQEYSKPFVVSRINLDTGDQTVVGSAPILVEAAIVAPNGAIFLPVHGNPGLTASIASDGGQTVFEFPSRHCNQHMLWVANDSCVLSANGAVLAIMNEAGGISVFQTPR